MFRKLTIALIATAALGTAALAPTSASAWHGGGGGWGGGRGGYHGGWGGFHGGWGGYGGASAEAPVSALTTPIDAALGDITLAKNILGCARGKAPRIK